jgi:hypothetical protein
MKIRFAQAQDAEDANRFFNANYSTKRTLAQWKWEFLPRDFSDGTMPFVIITDQDKIIGTQAFIPIKLIDESGVFWSVKSEKTLIDPSYRGQNLFKKMYEVLFDYLKLHGIHCIWGFTPATKAFERLNFAVPQVTSQVFFPFDSRAVTSVLERHAAAVHQSNLARLNALTYRFAGSLASEYSSFRYRAVTRSSDHNPIKLDIHVLDSPPSQAGELSERFIKLHGGITIYRDKNYLQWRLFDNPYVKAIMLGAFIQGQLVGWIAYSLGDDGMGYIIDIVAVPPSDFNQASSSIVSQLLAKAVDDLKKVGASGVRGWHVNSHSFDRLVLREAKNLGFYHIKRGHSVVLFTNPESPRYEKISSFNNWFVSRIFTEGVLG